jgi:hypothetical protein
MDEGTHIIQVDDLVNSLAFILYGLLVSGLIPIHCGGVITFWRNTIATGEQARTWQEP